MHVWRLQKKLLRYLYGLQLQFVVLYLWKVYVVLLPFFQLLWKALMLYIMLRQILSYIDKNKSCKGFAKHNKVEAAQ
jgi:hypothetical protein